MCVIGTLEYLELKKGLWVIILACFRWGGRTVTLKWAVNLFRTGLAFCEQNQGVLYSGRMDGEVEVDSKPWHNKDLL